MMVVLEKEEEREKEVYLTDVSRKFLIGKKSTGFRKLASQHPIQIYWAIKKEHGPTKNAQTIYIGPAFYFKDGQIT